LIRNWSAIAFGTVTCNFEVTFAMSLL
jgi:hypothetical protein